MKRFLVFAFDTFYPDGGWDDFKGDFDYLEDAKRFAGTIPREWIQIIDRETGERINV